MIRTLITTVIASVLGCQVYAQSIHLSQFYNAPMLITPANTGLMPENDFRLGLNYRNQWAALPVPYNTFSGWGDFKIGGNKERERTNWLGLGFAIYNDKAGDGQLALTQLQASIAYHLQMGTSSMISVGGSFARINRSLDFNRLIFDNQWTGISFNTNLQTGEPVGILRDNYNTVGAGINFAYFPNESLYLKIGAGAVNINRPVESFYNNNTDANIIKMRPSATVDAFIRTGDVFIVNPSAYYTTQSGAAEVIAGTLIRTILSSTNNGGTPIELIFGGFYRVGDAIIGAAGLQVGNIQFMASYDATLSGLGPYNNSYGALEFSLIYQGQYRNSNGKVKSSYSCPRFN